MAIWLLIYYRARLPLSGCHRSGDLAGRLRETIPGATQVVTIDDGRLFFPDDAPPTWYPT